MSIRIERIRINVPERVVPGKISALMNASHFERPGGFTIDGKSSNPLPAHRGRGELVLAGPPMQNITEKWVIVYTPGKKYFLSGRVQRDREIIPVFRCFLDACENSPPFKRCGKYLLRRSRGHLCKLVVPCGSAE